MSTSEENSRDIALWFLRVAGELVGHDFCVGSNDMKTMEDAAAIVEGEIHEEMEDLRQFWRDDPEHFRLCYPTVRVDDNGPVDHPWWGEDRAAILRAWMAMPPDRVRVVRDAVRAATLEVMDRVLLDYATGFDPDEDLERTAQQAFKAAVRDLRDELAEMT